MIESHKDIIDLWDTPEALAKRIGEEYAGRIGTDKVKALGKVLRACRDRSYIHSRYWRYICTVSACDAEHGVREELITCDILVDTQ